MSALISLVDELEVAHVVVGLPLSLSGSDTDQTRETRLFAARLARRLGSAVDVDLHDERFTTRMARDLGAGHSSEDSRAAAVLLESWLAGRAPQGAERASTGEDDPLSR